nr:hypothetical protein [Tanacetum cinerariifolium]
MNMALVLIAKAFKLNHSTPTNNNKRISSNPRNRQIAQPGMNMGQDRHIKMVGGNDGNLFRQYVGQNVGNQNGYNVVQNFKNQNPNRNGNAVVVRAEGNATGNNGNQIRCYNCRCLGHFARNYTVRPRRRDAAYLQTQLLIAQKEEARIQLQAKKFDLMAAAVNLDKITEVNANCILMANLQQASTSGIQTDKAPVYDSNRSAGVHNYDNCYDNEIYYMFTQEEQYTELLKPIPEPYQVQQNDNNVISKVSNMEQDGGTIYHHPATVEETHAYFESLYNSLAIEVEKGLPRIDETHALSKPVTSKSVPILQELKVMKNNNVTAPEMFRINPFKPSREEKYVSNKVRANVRTNSITVSQPHVITKKDVNSDSNGLSSTRVDNTAKTRMP